MLKSQKRYDFDNNNNNPIFKETDKEVLKKKDDNELGEVFNDILMNNISKSNEGGDQEANPDVEILKSFKARDLDPRIWNALKFMISR